MAKKKKNKKLGKKKVRSKPKKKTANKRKTPPRKQKKVKKKRVVKKAKKQVVRKQPKTLKRRKTTRPRRGTKKYKRWLKKYRHLRKCSRARALAYRLRPDLFPTYHATGAFCSFFLKKKVRLTKKSIEENLLEWIETLNKPDIPDYYFSTLFWFEIDFRMDELRDYVISKGIPNLWVRSQLSSVSPFLIDDYTYDTTFKAYVDWRNALQEGTRDANRDYTELWVSLHFNPRKMRWEILVEEQDEPNISPYVPKLPFNDLVKEDFIESEEGPIIARGGEEKVSKKKGKKAKEKEAVKPKRKKKLSPKEIEDQIKILEQKRDALYTSVDLLVKEMINYRKLNETELYTQAKEDVKELRHEIDTINKQIVNMKTMEKGGVI